MGGGIVGLSTAWWLARSGTKPIVLEASHLASRASGRNAGFLLTGSPEPYGELEGAVGPEAARAFWELTRENRDLLRAEILDPGTIDCDFLPEGSWLAAVGDEETTPEEAVEKHQLRESCERLRDLGFEVEWHEGEAVRKAAGSPLVHGAIRQPRDGGLDPVRLCRGLAAASGADIRTGARVQALEPTGDGIRLVTSGGDVVADRVVVATNAYVSSLLPHLAQEIRPARGQMIATAPDRSGATRRGVTGVWYLNRGFEYVRQLGDGTLLVGGCRREAEAVEVGYLEHPTATVQGALERFLARAYPALGGRPIVRRWAGIMAMTPDGLPRAGEAPDRPGVLFAVGMNGHGMSLGFVTGRWLARRVLGETSEPLLPPARPDA